MREFLRFGCGFLRAIFNTYVPLINAFRIFLSADYLRDFRTVRSLIFLIRTKKNPRLAGFIAIALGMNKLSPCPPNGKMIFHIL